MTLMAGGRPLSLLRGGGERRRPTSLAAFGVGGGIGRPHDKDKVVVKYNECCDISITMLGEEAVVRTAELFPPFSECPISILTVLFMPIITKA